MHQAIFYKRCSVLLRALNARLRLMPAHRLAQRLTRHSGSGGAHARDAGLTEPPARAEPPSAGSASAAGVGGSGVRMLYAMSLENGGRQQPVAHQVACSTQAGSGFPTGALRPTVHRHARSARTGAPERTSDRGAAAPACRCSVQPSGAGGYGGARTDTRAARRRDPP